MIITLDYNNDRIILQNEENDPEVMTYNKVKDLRKTQELLYEIINMLEPTNVTIKAIDEDSQTIVGEW